MDIEELLNHGEIHELQDIIKKYFNNDSELFFDYVIDEGLTSKETLDVSMADLFPNQYLNYFMSIDSNQVKDYVAKQLTDVEKIDGKYYMVLDDITSLGEFFSDSRNSASVDYIKSVISGDVDLYNSYDDFGDEIVDDLTPENTQKLIEKIKEDGLNKEIDFNGSDGLIETFIEADGNVSTFILTSERLNQIIAQRDGLYELINESDNFEELKRDMNSWYNWSYEQAYSDEIYNKVMSEVADLFSVDVENLGKWKSFSIKRYDGSTYTSEKYLVNVDNIFFDVIKSSVSSDLKYWDEQNRLIGYHGNLESYLKDEWENPTIYLDYVSPDWKNLEEIYNSHFSDNI